MRPGAKLCAVPPTCHTEIVNLLNKNVPLFDDICKRSLKFIQLCMTSDNRVVNFIARHGVLYSRMLSVAGRHIQLCSLFIVDNIDGNHVFNNIYHRRGMIKKIYCGHSPCLR